MLHCIKIIFNINDFKVPSIITDFTDNLPWHNAVRFLKEGPRISMTK